MRPRKLALFIVLIFIFCCCGTPYGVWHRVKRGETLYRISRAYGVPMEKIMKHNPQITDPTLIIAGDKLFIPGATEAKSIPPPEQPPDGFAQANSQSNGSSSNRFGTIEESPVEKKKSGEFIAPVEKQGKKAPKDFWEKRDLGFAWPTKGKITSTFGDQRDGRAHRGIDIAAPMGTPIFAAESGQTIFSGKISGYGKVIVIEHPSGYVSVYAHNSKNLVEAGSWVKRGDQIAEVGDTGRASGPHLHFEIRVNNSPVDPLKYLPKGG